MVNLHTILADHRSRSKRHIEADWEKPGGSVVAPSEIPNLFFDQVLVEYKLTRVEILVLMYLYRKVWCGPNLYTLHGISPLLSHTEMAKQLHQNLEDVQFALRSLEECEFIMTVRSGQYFVRKFFTKQNDDRCGQTYDDFES